MGKRGRFYFFCGKAKMRAYKLLMIAAVGILAAGCDRMFKDSITFRGEVYYGTLSEKFIGVSTITVVQVIGPGVNAVVQEAEHEETVLTDAAGRYSLPIKAYRSFMSNKTDTYTIQVFAPRNTNYAQDEYTTVKARPGDSIEVRPLVLLQITDEDKNF